MRIHLQNIETREIFKLLESWKLEKDPDLDQNNLSFFISWTFLYGSIFNQIHQKITSVFSGGLLVLSKNNSSMAHPKEFFSEFRFFLEFIEVQMLFKHLSFDIMSLFTLNVVLFNFRFFDSL